MLEHSEIHPVRFDHQIQCGIRDGGYRQIVQCGDVTQFQFRTEICNGYPNLIGNPGFTESLPAPWVLGGLFTYNSNSGSVTKQSGGGVFGVLSQPLAIANGTVLKLTIEISVVAGSVGVVMGSNLIEVIGESGTYEYWVTAQNISTLDIFADPSGVFVVSNVSLYVVPTEYAVQIVNESGTPVRTITTSANPAYFDFANGFVTVSFDWVDDLGECLPDDCYYFEIADPCNCGQLGVVFTDFITTGGASLWTLDDQWTVENGVANFDTPGIASGGATLFGLFCPGVEYTVTFELVGISIGERFRVYLGGTAGPLVSSNGVHTQTITASGFGILGSVLTLYGQSTIGAASFSVVDFSISAVSLDFEYRSNWFRLYETAPCSVLISACNNSDNLQAGYNGTGFSPKIRLAARFGQGGYRNQFKDYENTWGKLSNYYYRGRKVPQLIFVAAEYVHDFVAHLKGYDHVYIDGTEYAIESDDYTPAYVEDFDFGEGTLQVSLKRSIIEKTTKTSNEKTCEIDGQGVSLEGANSNGGGFAILTEFSEKIQTG